MAGESAGRWSGRGSAPPLGLGGLMDWAGSAEVLAGRDPVDGREAPPCPGRPSCFQFRPGVLRTEIGQCPPHARTRRTRCLRGRLPRIEAQAVTRRRRLPAERNGLGVGAGCGRGEQLYPVCHRSSGGRDSSTGPAGQLDPHPPYPRGDGQHVAQGVDGSWSALDSRRLFLHRRATEAVYGARRSPPPPLGYCGCGLDFGPPPARWAVEGVDPVLCRLFSQRAASIDEHARRGGARHVGRGARRVAFHADRPDKERGLTVDGLRSRWRRRAGIVGLDLGELSAGGRP